VDLLVGECLRAESLYAMCLGVPATMCATAALMPGLPPRRAASPHRRGPARPGPAGARWRLAATRTLALRLDSGADSVGRAQ
jgi:hypothetical protein